MIFTWIIRKQHNATENVFPLITNHRRRCINTLSFHSVYERVYITFIHVVKYYLFQLKTRNTIQIEFLTFALDLS